MKSLLMLSGVLWLVLVFEQARPDLIPTYSMLLPVCSVCLVTSGMGRCVVLVGLALIVTDLLSMNAVPWVTVPVLLAGTWLSSRQERSAETDQWLRAAVVLTVIGASCHFASVSVAQRFDANALKHWMAVAVPTLILASIVYRVSQEFRLRYSL